MNRIGELTFLLDLNEVERDGTAPVSLDFTTNFVGVTVPIAEQPVIGTTVRVVDDEGSVYDAAVVRINSPRDFTVRVDWDSEIPSINRVWTSAGGGHVGIVPNTRDQDRADEALTHAANSAALSPQWTCHRSLLLRPQR